LVLMEEDPWGIWLVRDSPARVLRARANSCFQDKGTNTMVIVDPCTFPERLRKAGFDDVQVDVLKPYAFRFRARKAAVTFPAKDEVSGV
jgi:hypothetical protein